MAQPLLHVVPVAFTQTFVVSEELMGGGGADLGRSCICLTVGWGASVSLHVSFPHMRSKRVRMETAWPLVDLTGNHTA